MGVLGDNTINTAVHQVVNFVHVRVFHRWQRAWQDHLKRLNSKYTDSPSLFSTTFRDKHVAIGVLQFLRSFGGFSNAKSAGFWGRAPDPDGGASSAPPYPLAGREGCPPPAPSPGRLRLQSAPPLSRPPNRPG